MNVGLDFQLPQTGFNRQKACRYGQMLYNINDMYVGKSFELYGEFSEGEVEVFRQIIRPGDVVLDVGANIGSHTLFFAKHVGPTGHVIAFEPQRHVYYALCANVALNSLMNVWCYNKAAGTEPGQITVPELDPARVNNFGGLGLGLYQHGEQIPVITLDSLNLQRCNFIKIDVEGMEKVVLGGAVNLLARLKPVLYVENDREDRSAELIRFIDELGYNMYWHRPYLYNAQNYFGNPNNVFGNIVSVNMICFHKSVAVDMKGASAVAVPR